MKNIKLLTFDDLDLVNSFINNNINDFSTFIDLGWSLKNIKQQFLKNNNFSLIYFYQNKVSGLLIGEKIEANSNEYELELHIIFVSRNIRRKNIGTEMLNFIEKNKRSLNISKIFLEVSDKNSEAIKFYKKNNFVLFNFRHNYYREKNNMHNAICYLKNI